MSALIEVSENVSRKIDYNKVNFLIIVSFIRKLNHFFYFARTSIHLLPSHLTDRWQYDYANNILVH